MSTAARPARPYVICPSSANVPPNFILTCSRSFKHTRLNISARITAKAEKAQPPLTKDTGIYKIPVATVLLKMTKPVSIVPSFFTYFTSSSWARRRLVLGVLWPNCAIEASSSSLLAAPRQFAARYFLRIPCSSMNEDLTLVSLFFKLISLRLYGSTSDFLPFSKTPLSSSLKTSPTAT